MVERRDDVGMKVIVSIFISIIMLFVGLFVNTAWMTANEGKNKAYEVAERVVAIEARFSSIQSDLTEIKNLLRRRVPTQ